MTKEFNVVLRIADDLVLVFDEDADELELRNAESAVRIDARHSEAVIRAIERVIAARD